MPRWSNGRSDGMGYDGMVREEYGQRSGCGWIDPWPTGWSVESCAHSHDARWVPSGGVV